MDLLILLLLLSFAFGYLAYAVFSLWAMYDPFDIIFYWKFDWYCFRNRREIRRIEEFARMAAFFQRASTKAFWSEITNGQFERRAEAIRRRDWGF